MCGIAGYVKFEGQHDDLSRPELQAMTDALTHRGPDESGYYVNDQIGFGHRRLSIIDIATGQQPMVTEDQRFVLVFNGEIYNYKTLQAELTAKGEVFKTNSDTEVILRGVASEGIAFTKKLRGMFAFSVWDNQEKTLYCVRDRLGIKPFFYAHVDGAFLFGSELKALAAYKNLPRKMRADAIEDYFAFGYIPEPKTIYQSVQKLSPGHLLIAREGQAPKIERYWQLDAADDLKIDFPDAQVELYDRIKEAVDIRMIAEVPLGAFLSGGVDSSSVVATMSHLSDDPVKTCSIRFDDPKYNEAEFAEQVAKRYQTDHHESTVAVDDYALLDTLASLYDEPYADSSAMPTYRVCELAKKSVTVALSGDGGDETMAGYRRYNWHMNEEKLRGLMPQSIRGPLFGLLGRVYPKLDFAPRFLRAQSTFQSLARDTVSGYFHSVSILRDDMRAKLFSDSFKQELAGYQAIEVMREHAKNCPSDHPLTMIQYLDLNTYLVGDILTKVDRASMAHSLEVRVPLLDHKLVEWLFRLPRDYRLRGNEGKYIFKKTFEPHLPSDILYRPKMGFAIPLTKWFRGPLREKVSERLLSDRILDTGFFDRKYLQTLIDDHLSGYRDYSAPIWTLMMFERFLANELGESDNMPQISSKAPKKPIICA